MTTSIGDLALKIGVNSVDFGAGLKAAGEELKTWTQRSKEDVDGLATSFGLLKDIASGVYAGMGKQNQQVKEQSDLWSKIEDTIGDVTAGFLLAQVPLLGIFATTEKVASATEKWGGDLDHVTDRLAAIYAFSRTLGETTENTQVTLRAFERGGLSDEDARHTAQRFFQRVGGAKTSLEEMRPDGTAHALNQLGLDARDLAGSGFSRASEQVITSLGKLDDKWKQNEISMQIFGKSYQELEELIRRSDTIFDDARKDVAAFGQDDGVIKMAEETRLAWKEVSNDWQREVTGPIGSAWQRLYANLDKWNADFWLGIDKGLTWLEKKLRELPDLLPKSAPHSPEDDMSTDELVLRQLKENGADKDTIDVYEKRVEEQKHAALIRKATTRTDGTPWYGPNARVDRMGNRLPEDDLYHQYTDQLLPRQDGETFDEQRARTQREILDAGAHIGVTGPDGKQYEPKNQAEQLARLRVLNPAAFDLGSAADPSRGGMNDAYASNLSMREDFAKRIRTNGMSPDEIHLDDLRKQLTGPLSGDQRAEAERMIDATRKVIREFEDLGRSTDAMNRGFDVLGQAFDTSLGSAGVAIAEFNERLSAFNNSGIAEMGGDADAQRRLVATDAFLRLERSLPSLPGVAGPVNADSAEAIRVVANARRNATSNDPMTRVARTTELAREIAERQLSAFERLADAIEKNGLAVAGIN